MSADPCVRPVVDSVACGADVLIRASGELDLIVHEQLHAALARAGKLSLIIDLGDVTFVDVATITLFARAAEQRSTLGRRTVIVNCSPAVRRVFSLARAEHLLAP